jgi:hypothetical protein
MKSGEEIEKTFQVLETIEEVKVNHFFKHKVLQEIQNQQEEKPSILSWFTPKLQLAALGLILLMNMSAVFYAYSSQETTSSNSLDTFAQEYSLESKYTSILN